MHSHIAYSQQLTLVSLAGWYPHPLLPGLCGELWMVAHDHPTGPGQFSFSADFLVCNILPHWTVKDAYISLMCHLFR